MKNPILVYVVTARTPISATEALSVREPVRTRVDIAKFFRRGHAAKHATDHCKSYFDVRVEERAESEDEQHDEHFGAWQAEAPPKGGGAVRR
jgi:hypothetical protein